jgi:hypothetical protein
MVRYGAVHLLRLTWAYFLQKFSSAKKIPCLIPSGEMFILTIGIIPLMADIFLFSLADACLNIFSERILVSS